MFARHLKPIADLEFAVAHLALTHLKTAVQTRPTHLRMIYEVIPNLFTVK